MPSAHDKPRISSRFSASAPELSSASSTSDAVTPSNLQSHSASQSDESLPRPPLIIVSSLASSENRLKLLDDSEGSSRIDGRLLTTSQCNNSPRASSSSTPIMSSNLDVVLPSNTNRVQPQTEQPSSTGDRNSARTVEEVVVLQEALGHRLDELRRALSRHQRRARGLSLRGCWNAFRGFFGYGPEGTNARKEIVSLIVKLGFGFTQVAVIIIILILGAVKKSPVDHTKNEWRACHRPLGIWSALWSVRAVLGCFVALWMYQHRSSRLLDLRNRRANATVEANPPQPHIPDGPARPPALNDAANDTSNNANNVNTNDNANPLQHRNNSPVARLGSILTLASAVWFIVAHAFLYTSTTTCRFSAPHLWWLTFGIVCIGYIVILELLVVVILIFIIGPLLMLTINMILICLGREPIQLTSSQPKVGKLPLKAVESIPLVLYIPAPVNKNPEPPKTEKDESVSKPEAAHVHAYPPQRDCPSPSSFQSTGTRVQSRRSKRWFTFRRVSSKKEAEFDSKESRVEDSYEDKWEKGEYPFVRLEENRAVCAICLCDFEEPRRVRYSIGSMPPLDQEEKAIGGIVEPPTEVNADDALRLADAGDGAQPLRLLDCAHVFHKTCIDPWLTEVSGRCPVCQKPVEPKVYSKRKQRRD